VMKHLESAGAEVVFYDPYVPAINEHGRIRHGEPRLDAALVQSVDLVMITTAHTKVDYSMVQANARAIFDTKNAMRDVANRSNIELL
jgi:UDP-N-acetyl-D-glucosamine dehydrogenase